MATATSCSDMLPDNDENRPHCSDSVSPSTVLVPPVHDVTPMTMSRNNKENSSRNDSSSNDDEGDEGETTTAEHRSPKRLRRSRRNTDRIVLSSSRDGALQYRRMEELFFQEQDQRRRRRRQHHKQTALVLGKFRLERVFCAPNIYTIDNFLRPTDLEFLQSRISKGHFQKSFVDNSADHNDDNENNNNNNAKMGSLLDDSHRTSMFLNFAKQENAKVAAIEERAAKLLGCYSTEQIEPLQLVRYLPGQFFGVHHDMGNLDETTGEVELPAKSVLVKRRLVTIFCYINDLEENQGGCTGFPCCNNLQVQPQQGRAVLFSNVTAHGMPDPRTIHAGQVVHDTRKAIECKDGKLRKLDKVPVKYGLNIWICES